MNISESVGESSCKRQENGDVSTGSERPLKKKARFAWQVKGKYHLKNETSETPKTTTIVPNEQDRAGSSSKTESVSNDLVGSTEQNLEILGDYLLKQDFNTLDSVIADTDKSLLKPNANITPEKLQYPKYVSKYDDNGCCTSSSTQSECTNTLIPMSLVYTCTEDQCIARWQARQMAKGFVDNTINRVLDSWMVAPLPADMDNNRFLALDVAEFINNLPASNTVEDEGILMAISAHGLQNTSSPSNNVERNLNSTSVHVESGLSPLNSPAPPDEETMQDLSENNNKQSDTDGGSSNALDMSWTYSDEIRRNVHTDLARFTFFPDFSSSSYDCFNDEFDREENVSSSDTDMTSSHYEFLDAAVSFAIQNKGLTSYGTDYG